jgi:hypothetical protein
MTVRLVMRRASLAAAVLALLGFVNAPAASANWHSYIEAWTDGEESRRWDDGSYSQVQFQGCFAQGGLEDRVDVIMWRDITAWPDEEYDEKTFSACFGGGTSNGEWSGLSDGDYYFEADRVAQGGSCCLLNVQDVYVDTTKAD